MRRYPVLFQKEEPGKDKEQSQRKPAAYLGGLWSLWFLEEPRDFSLLCFNALQFKRRGGGQGNEEKEHLFENRQKPLELNPMNF